MVQVEPGIAVRVVVADPFAVAVDVRRLGVTLHVAEIALRFGGGMMLLRPCRRRPMLRNVTAADVFVAAAAALVSFFLCVSRRCERQRHCQT
jgi:hypothetical protein